MARMRKLPVVQSVQCGTQLASGTITRNDVVADVRSRRVARALRATPADAGTPKRPLYRLATAVRALIARETKPDGRGGNGDVARLANERARLAKEQADQVALKNAVARREYVPLALVMREVTMIFQVFRERCLSIPGKVASTCEMRSQGEVFEIIKAEIYEALEELSRPILPQDGPPLDVDVIGDDGDDDRSRP